MHIIFKILLFIYRIYKYSYLTALKVIFATPALALKLSVRLIVAKTYSQTTMIIQQTEIKTTLCCCYAFKCVADFSGRTLNSVL